MTTVTIESTEDFTHVTTTVVKRPMTDADKADITPQAGGLREPDDRFQRPGESGTGRVVHAPGLERARRSISKSDIGTKIDAGRYPLLALLLLMSPQAPPPPVLIGFAGGHASLQWSIMQFRAVTDRSLHVSGCGEITQSMQV